MENGLITRFREKVFPNADIVNICKCIQKVFAQNTVVIFWDSDININF